MITDFCPTCQSLALRWYALCQPGEYDSETGLSITPTESDDAAAAKKEYIEHRRNEHERATDFIFG